jgi:molecular chaperone HtpG
MKSKKTLEINSTHQVVTKNVEHLEADAEDKSTKEMVHLLYETVVLSSRFSLKNPVALSSRISRIVEVLLDVSAKLEEFPPIIHTMTITRELKSVDDSELKKFYDLY